jgi:hypothetical protein
MIAQEGIGGAEVRIGSVEASEGVDYVASGAEVGPEALGNERPGERLPDGWMDTFVYTCVEGYAASDAAVRLAIPVERVLEARDGALRLMAQSGVRLSKEQAEATAAALAREKLEYLYSESLYAWRESRGQEVVSTQDGLYGDQRKQVRRSYGNVIYLNTARRIAVEQAKIPVSMVPGWLPAGERNEPIQYQLDAGKRAEKEAARAAADAPIFSDPYGQVHTHAHSHATPSQEDCSDQWEDEEREDQDAELAEEHYPPKEDCSAFAASEPGEEGHAEASGGLSDDCVYGSDEEREDFRDAIRRGEALLRAVQAAKGGPLFGADEELPDVSELSGLDLFRRADQVQRLLEEAMGERGSDRATVVRGSEDGEGRLGSEDARLAVGAGRLAVEDGPLAVEGRSVAPGLESRPLTRRERRRRAKLLRKALKRR